MRHVHERDPDLALQPLELDLHLLAQLEVERAERLVEEEHGRSVHERPRDRDPLLLAAREFVGLTRRVLAEMNELEGFGHSPLDIPPVRAGFLRSERHVVVDGEVREQRVL